MSRIKSDLIISFSPRRERRCTGSHRILTHACARTIGPIPRRIIMAIWSNSISLRIWILPMSEGSRYRSFFKNRTFFRSIWPTQSSLRAASTRYTPIQTPRREERRHRETSPFLRSATTRVHGASEENGVSVAFIPATSVHL